MNGYPRDMFEEMDEIFDHLFARMQEDFMTGKSAGFRIPDRNREPWGTPRSAGRLSRPFSPGIRQSRLRKSTGSMMR